MSDVVGRSSVLIFTPLLSCAGRMPHVVGVANLIEGRLMKAASAFYSTVEVGPNFVGEKFCKIFSCGLMHLGFEVAQY